MKRNKLLVIILVLLGLIGLICIFIQSQAVKTTVVIGNEIDLPDEPSRNQHSVSRVNPSPE